MFKKFWDFFTKQYAVTALLINLALVFLFIQLHTFGSDFKIAVGIFAVLAALLVFDWRLKKHHDRREMRRLHSEFINDLLEAAAKSIARVTDIDHMRACLMVPEGDILRITRGHGFSESDNDLELRVLVGTGVAGRAWATGRVVIADLHQRTLPGGSDWALPDAENLKVRSTLKSIMSIPIKGGQPFRLLGILNLDSDHTMAETRFFDDDIQHIAYCFSKVLSALLDETD